MSKYMRCGCAYYFAVLVAEKIRTSRPGNKNQEKRCAHCHSPELHERAGAGPGREACPLKDIADDKVARKAGRVALEKTEGLTGSAFESKLKKVIEEFA